MDAISVLWSKGKCPILNGVMFSDGAFEPVKTCVQPRPVGTLFLDGLGRTSVGVIQPPDVAVLASCCRAEDKARGIVAVGGEGGMGGDGFVALTDLDDHLFWIAFFDFSNPFVSVQISKDEIIAENNLHEKWHFPFRTPQRIRIEVPEGRGRGQEK